MLHSVNRPGTNVQFTYDHSGLRVQKRVNGVDTRYTLNGKHITHVQIGADTHLHIFYDAHGRPSMVRWNGTDYAYLHNLQGDVVGLMDMQGARVVEYLYDAWGRPLGTTGPLAQTLGKANPFRYRGYVWDEETGLYYLRSRYYDPAWGRFLNADVVLGSSGSVLDHDVYAYCANDPVNRTDDLGQAWWHWALAVAVVAVAAVAVVATAGGAAAGLAAVASVASGSVAATTASTVAAGTFIGTATGLGVGVAYAVATSGSVEEFADSGGIALGTTVVGGVLGGLNSTLKAMGKQVFRVKSTQVSNNPKDDYVVVGPKDGQVGHYVRQISSGAGYEPLRVTRLGDGRFQLANGHHRFGALIKLNKKIVNVRLTK